MKKSRTKSIMTSQYFFPVTIGSIVFLGVLFIALWLGGVFGGEYYSALKIDEQSHDEDIYNMDD